MASRSMIAALCLVSVSAIHAGPRTKKRADKTDNSMEAMIPGDGMPTLSMMEQTSIVMTKKPTCCWSKWGDATTCGEYHGSGGQCNTDRSKSCWSASNCPKGAKVAKVTQAATTTKAPSTTTTTKAPSTAATTSIAVTKTPACCWSNWGDATTCGEYDAVWGGWCNTDRSKSCSSASDCPGSIKISKYADNVCPPELCIMCTKCMEREMQSDEYGFRKTCLTSPARCNHFTWCRSVMENRFALCGLKWGLEPGSYSPQQLKTCITKILCNTPQTEICESWRAEQCSSSFTQTRVANSSTYGLDSESSRDQKSAVQAAMFDSKDRESSRGQESAVQTATHGSKARTMARRAKSKSQTDDADWAARSLDVSLGGKCS